MGQTPKDRNNRIKRTCLKKVNGKVAFTFYASPIYRNPSNYYEAGFECCKINRTKAKPEPKK